VGALNRVFEPARLDLFWRFVFERQCIWHRRFVQVLPPPWTNDPILRHERFTNVYRELDPGTQYVIESILELEEERIDKLFNVMLYRLLGRSATHTELGFQRVSSFDSRDMEQRLKNLRARGLPPFTGAYMVSAYSSMGSSDKIENIGRLFKLLQAEFGTFSARVLGSNSAKEAHGVLNSAYGFGNFLAFQVLVDLLYPLRAYGGHGLLPFSHEDWASAGPGAQKGIRMLLKSGTRPTNLEVMRWLRDTQHDEFKRLGLDFPYLVGSHHGLIPLSLANIQNCLCEFHKYVKIQEGSGRGRRKFDLGDAGLQTALPWIPDAAKNS